MTFLFIHYCVYQEQAVEHSGLALHSVEVEGDGAYGSVCIDVNVGCKVEENFIQMLSEPHF